MEQVVIPTIARKTLNVVLALTYACATSLVVGFLGGFAVGFGNEISSTYLDPAFESLIYAMAGMFGLVLYVSGLVVYRKQLFIQKQ